MNIAKPHDLHTLRAFLGLTSYFRRCIPGFAAIAAPLERWKQKYVAFKWDDDCDGAFQQLQRELVRPAILMYPDFTKRIKLYVDSPHLVVGTCLIQAVEGRERVIAYASKMLAESQRNWVNRTSGTTEFECWETSGQLASYVVTWNMTSSICIQITRLSRGSSEKLLGLPTRN
ncbi:hypothetical protein PC110_g10399 [Phytophthora cactorum]|uniref:Reverse transcriptase/retrotransposon-derived protein RNase H-like domain-containing protein n=1 Tax=Phytophthora cactorum TaxID=29920 RepID=A0A329SBH4_9STRA|nr:hypothetical protein PC110_g10399 [Phytophthora cactorum]